MTLTDYSSHFLSLAPAIIAIVITIMTRKVLLSLGIAILVGALMLNEFAPTAALNYILQSIMGIFWQQGEANSVNISMIIFMLLLGVLINQITHSGAILAFTEWAVEKCHSRKKAKLLTALLVLVFFIDDFLHCLSVGAICRPITDRFSISRAKLAYLLDSTAAPVCVLMPISSWGAYIIAVIGGIFASLNYQEFSPFIAFTLMIPMNFYALITLAIVIFVVFSQTDIGPMRREEENALAGQLWDMSKGEPVCFDVNSKPTDQGRLIDLFLPVTVLLASTMTLMLVTGSQALNQTEAAFSILAALEQTDLGLSLVGGVLASIFTSWLLGLRVKRHVSTQLKNMLSGMFAMCPVIIILLFAWTVSTVMSDMQTGLYLSGIISGHLSPGLLPVLVFLLSCAMAFATGTSWGTFGIMLPLAADITAVSDINLLLPVLSAVLAGAVFGDHSSPISSTSILSANGAGCHHMDHVMTQLPYALIAASGAALSYLAIGLSNSVLAGIFVSLIWFVGFCICATKIGKPKYLFNQAARHKPNTNSLYQ